jgi:hypothetical protein
MGAAIGLITMHHCNADLDVREQAARGGGQRTMALLRLISWRSVLMTAWPRSCM